MDSPLGGNLNSRSMVPCLVRGGPLFLVGVGSASATGGSPVSPPSSGVGSKVLRTGFGCVPELLGGEGPGDVGVLDDAGIEARFAAFTACVLCGRDACDIDCGRTKGGEFRGLDWVIPR